MIVQKVLNNENQERYILITYEGMPIAEANQFIKFKDNTGKARKRCFTSCKRQTNKRIGSWKQKIKKIIGSKIFRSI